LKPRRLEKKHQKFLFVMPFSEVDLARVQFNFNMEVGPNILSRAGPK